MIATANSPMGEISENAAGDRDLVWEALNEASATAHLWNKQSLHLVLEHVKDAYEAGRIGQWAVRLERGEANLDSSLASLEVAG